MIFSHSVICVYICVWCVPKKSIKEFRNSSWYQSQFSETLIPSGHLLFRPSFIPAKSLWPSLNPTISLSDHLSFRSSVPVVRVKGENAFRSVESSSENIHRRQLFRRTFFYTARSAWRRSPIFPKALEPENHPRAGHARFSGDALPPPSSPDADQPPFLPVSAIQALHVPLLGSFCFRGPSDQIFRRPPAIFSQL